MENKKIYLIVDFEQGFYESDTDYTKLIAVSTDLNTLCENNKNVGGQLLIVDEEVFNTQLDLVLSDSSIYGSKGIEVKNFGMVVKEYQNNQKKKISLK